MNKGSSFTFAFSLYLSPSSPLLFFSLSKALPFVFIDVILHFFIKKKNTFNSFICSLTKQNKKLKREDIIKEERSKMVSSSFPTYPDSSNWQQQVSS